MGNKVIKSVSFNITNAEDQIILKHVARRNFSGYVKKLIINDINSKAQNKVVEEIPLQPEQSIKGEQKTSVSASHELSNMKRQTIGNAAPKIFTPRNN